MVNGRARRYFSGAAALVFVSVAVPAGVRPGEPKREVIDRVVAVVEDHAVLQSELDVELKRIMVQSQHSTMTDEESKKLLGEVLEGLIADHLMSVHAEKVGVKITDEEIDSEVERLIEENKRALGSEEAFEAQLEMEGLTLEQLRTLYREKTRSRMLIQRLMYSEVMGEVQVTEGEVRRYYNEHAAELPKRPETVTLAQIVLVPRTSGEMREAALARIREIEKKLRGGADFAAVARESSEGPSAKFGGSLGYKRLEDFGSPEFTEAVRSLTVGEMSEPVLTRFGYHIIKLEDVRAEEVLVRHVLIKLESSEEDVAETARLAQRIRDEIAAGADFGEMAARYSADEATKDRGGVVGEIAISNLPDFFMEYIRDTAVGAVAPVVRETDRFRIVKVLGRSPERAYTMEEAREELKRLIEQQRLQERFQSYVEDLKKIYYVEVKGEAGK